MTSAHPVIGRAYAALALLLVFGACSSNPTDTTNAGTFPVPNPAPVTPTTLPTSGPWFHTVRTASSSDGLTFHDDRTADLVVHASVPAALRMPNGTLRIYFVDFESGAPERVSCVESTDNGASYHWGGCEVTGLVSSKAVDPCPVLLDDGRVRLYFFASPNDVNASGIHNVDAAISSDGVHFVREGTALALNGLVDPDVFWTGSQWVMHVFSLEEGGTVVATSSNGLNFTKVGILSPRNYGVTKPLRLTNGTFRMYAFSQPDAGTFVSMTSPDGLNWTLEPGTRFSVSNSFQITDPYVIARGDGTWLMTYKRSQRP
jgi:hypothetical protein